MEEHKSAFGEAGLSDTKDTPSDDTPRRERRHNVRFRSEDEIYVVERYEDEVIEREGRKIKLRRGRPTLHLPTANQSPLPAGTNSIMYRFGAVLCILAGVWALLQTTSLFGHYHALPIPGVSGGVIQAEPRSHSLERRDDSPTDWCFKWAQQSALVNGTLYLYGGQMTTTDGQTQDTWNNDFVVIDLTKTWNIASPSISGLPQPSGPPAVALGYLWSSKSSLYLYGGEFQWQPPTSPVPFATWEYDISSASWIEHSDPVTSYGNSASSGNVPVQRAAEGAGVNIPSMGRGYYFGGHLDGYTTPGWEQWIPRVYLQSLLEYTFPGYGNDQVTSLGSGGRAGAGGVYRNITNAGLQADAGFTKRADGLLMYVPGFGGEGILVALAGGTNDSFTQMNIINVYDIATSSWYEQATAGTYPKTRVNPCAVIAAAPDGSSYNIYMFGGQNLIPYADQTQYQDMWVLTIPSFTWIEVDQSNQSVPYGRSGATCNIWDAQMVMVGGYLGKSANGLSCESPATYVFNLSSLQWQEQFTALSADANGLGPTNPLNQQANQREHGSNPGGLEGSYGYTVPQAIINVIGGDVYGAATLTTPVVTATAGPLKTGEPQTYTLTRPNGQTVTETSVSVPVSSIKHQHDTKVAVIVVGVVCGVLAVVICYLLFCLFVYRKQLALYKRHVELSQASARGEKVPDIPGLWLSESGKGSDSDRPGPSYRDSGSHAGSRPSGPSSGIQTGSAVPTPGRDYQSARRSSGQSSTEDLLAGHEPTFVGVMLNPRRSLRVINRD